MSEGRLATCAHGCTRSAMTVRLSASRAVMCALQCRGMLWSSNSATTRRSTTSPGPAEPRLADALEEFIRQHEQAWLDESIPALSGVTPRRAAADPSRREVDESRPAACRSRPVRRRHQRQKNPRTPPLRRKRRAGAVPLTTDERARPPR
ncbi:protein of unknown function [Blastococcus saxobsidens DD2]|uniref:Uncharacterized protein n=1 Tax=Blastococcus saxobsidens (strain DD2) TaxID=1146883 RepID=H6RJW0_BLASD|nr:protein of unknown function [Blastococcus saxobsidens DD2]